MHLLTNHSLRHLNTFGFDRRAEHFVRVRTRDEVEEALALARLKGWPVFVLGGGSNLVLVDDIPGLVIQLGDDALHYVPQGDPDTAPAPISTEGPALAPGRVVAAGGLVWDELVQRTLVRGLNGLENLSLIPGSVGAAPVQNIGAYGVELEERLLSVRAWHLSERCWVELSRQDCRFAYRDSRFKREADQWLIYDITLRLGDDVPLRHDYASLASALAANGIGAPDARQISEQVRAIRRSRLPDPARLGNAGSFFHNPEVDATTLVSLLKHEPELVYYPRPDGSAKLAAGWLIERAGFKGVRRDTVGVHDRQALVLVHHGGGSGEALMDLARAIRASVKERFGVSLQIEPRVVPDATLV